MATARKFHSSASISKVLHLVVCCGILTTIAHGQPETLANAINEVRLGNYSYVQQIVRIAGPTQAVPILQDLFSRGEDADTKGWIASQLIKLGEKDDIYWAFVVQQAQEVLESDEPYPFTFDAQGKVVPGQISPEFTAWAEAHNLSLNEAGIDAIFPVKLAPLIMVGDARAIPLLRRGLLVPNYLVEAAAASALVRLKDRDSIPLIVEACKRAPAEAASAIAMSLLQFHDPEAQSAVEPYLPKDLAKTLHQETQQPKEPVSPQP